MVKLLDCTTRDGGHCTNWEYSYEYIFNLVSDIKLKKINFLEIGYRNYYDKKGKGAFYYCTPDLINKFSDVKDYLNIGVMVDTKRYNESDFSNAKDDCIDFVRVATHPEQIEETLHIAEMLNIRNYNVMVQLMDITNLTQEHYELLDNWQNKSFIKVLYLADTYGIINPEVLEQVYSRVKDMGYKNIGFHAHNKTHQALSNSIKAVELGAYSIDVMQDVAGINGGNLSYNDFIESMNYAAI